MFRQRIAGIILSTAMIMAMTVSTYAADSKVTGTGTGNGNAKVQTTMHVPPSPGTLVIPGITSAKGVKSGSVGYQMKQNAGGDAFECEYLIRVENFNLGSFGELTLTNDGLTLTNEHGTKVNATVEQSLTKIGIRQEGEGHMKFGSKDISGKLIASIPEEDGKYTGTLTFHLKCEEIFD